MSSNLQAYKLIIALALVSCAKDNKANKEPDPTVPVAELEQRISDYCTWSKPIYDGNGGNVEAECDGALFTGLHGTVCDYVTISQFENGTGQLFRTPQHDCFTSGRSKSGFSRDMATGLQLYAATREPNQELYQRVVDYGTANDWVVCDAVDSVTLAGRCLMSPKIVGRWIDLAGGPPYSLLEDSSDSLFANVDFQAHLDVISILVEWQMYGAISDGSLQTLKVQAEREPNNMLYVAAYRRFAGGNLGEVGRGLLDRFPADRLPNNHQDYCTSYLYQRDYVNKDPEKNIDGVSKNWLPCPADPYKTHPGTDFLLAAWVVLRDNP